MGALALTIGSDRGNHQRTALASCDLVHSVSNSLLVQFSSSVRRHTSPTLRNPTCPRCQNRTQTRPFRALCLSLYARLLPTPRSAPAMSQIHRPTVCDYCHQRPKFLYADSSSPGVVNVTTDRGGRNASSGYMFRPYDYCSRTCGSLATAVRNRGTGNPVICKVGFTLTHSLGGTKHLKCDF